MDWASWARRLGSPGRQRIKRARAPAMDERTRTGLTLRLGFGSFNCEIGGTQLADPLAATSTAMASPAVPLPHHRGVGTRSDSGRGFRRRTPASVHGFRATLSPGVVAPPESSRGAAGLPPLRSAGRRDACGGDRHRSRSGPRPSNVPTSCAMRTAGRTRRSPWWASGASCEPSPSPGTHSLIVQSTPASGRPRASTGHVPRLQSGQA